MASNRFALTTNDKSNQSYHHSSVNYQIFRGCCIIVPGLFAIGTHPAIMVKAPFSIPDDPIPATARPTINIFEELDTPQINEPNSKMVKNDIKVH